MSAIVEKEFDRNLRPRERHRGFPKLALRQRSTEHPMIMFFLVVAAAFTAMAVVPPSGAAFELPVVGSVSAELEAPRNVGLSEIGIACHGQVWAPRAPHASPRSPGNPAAPAVTRSGSLQEPELLIRTFSPPRTSRDT